MGTRRNNSPPSLGGVWGVVGGLVIPRGGIARRREGTRLMRWEKGLPNLYSSVY